jgi:Fe-S cluster biosynthesis and repair protein YggX
MKDPCKLRRIAVCRDFCFIRYFAKEDENIENRLYGGQKGGQIHTAFIPFLQIAWQQYSKMLIINYSNLNLPKSVDFWVLMCYIIKGYKFIICVLYRQQTYCIPAFFHNDRSYLGCRKGRILYKLLALYEYNLNFDSSRH